MKRTALTLVALAFAGVAGAAKWSGEVSAQWRGFTQSPEDPRQHGNNLSLAAEPEFYHSWNGGADAFTFVPFLRWDQGDSERSHGDIRELTWLHAADQWELRVGVRKVFWGVTESQHLVDIINQTDLVENIDTEDKLGQAMVNLALIRDWGTVDLFVLPYFRKRTFPGPRGRLRSRPPVAENLARFESSRKQRHIDLALRWSQVIGDWDVGLSHFYGTSREPRFEPGRTRTGESALIPVYDLIHQTGLDVQITTGAWLWKLEAIRRSGRNETFYAATGGLEYSFYGVFDSPADVGLVLEYLYDDRGATGPSPFQDDLMVGLRLALNDVQSSAALLGVVKDRSSGAAFYNLEANRRLGRSWTVNLQGRFFTGAPASDPLHGLLRDDYIELELARHF
ncbi:MAG TPA: hypothetical protein ENJ19_11110 [Gammaproteobacteria bacterium]|nr:hypothetical protein [Gammaproteobacteria bacterium]